jgi:heme-binding NEAT domain protein
MRIRHYGYKFEDLKATITNIVEKLTLTVASMNKFKQIQLNKKQIIKLAKEALNIRFGEVEMNRITVDWNEFVKPTRREDEGTDLWSVFNVVQEKVLEGDFNYVAGNKSRKARKIKNFNQDMELNSRLYELATTYCPN